MNRENTELGRSMVEMLGVLAVIGLLSVAGIFGYRHAMNKHKANEIIDAVNKKAVLVSAQIMANGDEVSEEELNSEYIDLESELDEDGNIITGSTQRKKSFGNSDFKIKKLPGEQFAIGVPDIDKETCESLINSLGLGSQVQYLMDKDEHEITDCDKAALEEVSFVYDNDLKKNNNETVYSDSDESDSRTGNVGNGSNNTERESSDGSETDEDSQKICPRGQQWMVGACVKCRLGDNCGCRELGKVADGNGNCRCPDDGATECDGSTSTACAAGYFLEDGSCYPCPEHAYSCNNDGLVCNEMYYKKDQECVSCLQDFYETIPLSGSTDYASQIDKCNATCFTGRYVVYSNTNGVTNMTGSCANLSSPQNLDSLSDSGLLNNYNYSGGSASAFNWNNMKVIFGENPTASEIRSKLHEIFDGSNYIVPDINNSHGKWFSAQSWCRAHGAKLVSYNDYFADNQKLGMAAQVIQGGYGIGNNGVLWAGMVNSSGYCGSPTWPAFRATRWQCSGSHSPDNWLYFLCKRN